MNICIHYCSQRLCKRSHSWHGEEISIVVHLPTFQKRWPISGHRLLAELLAAKAKSRVLIYNAAITKLTLGTLARIAFSALRLHRIAHPVVQTRCTRGPRVHVYRLCLLFICQANIFSCGEPYKSARCSTFTCCSAAAVITPRRESAAASRGSWREVQTAPSTLTPVDAILGMHACHIDLADHRLAERGNERWV